MKKVSSSKAAKLTRRRFLKTTSTALIGGAVLGSLPLESAAAVRHSESISGLQTIAPDGTKQRLLNGWDYHKGSLGGIWEAWRKAANDMNVWPPITLPHCFNASDAVDPDTPYYQGPGWYRTKIKIENPHPNGRTLLHFEGAGQKAEVHVHTEKVGSHVGGYDEFIVDITDAAARFSGSADVSSALTWHGRPARESRAGCACHVRTEREARTVCSEKRRQSGACFARCADGTSALPASGL